MFVNFLLLDQGVDKPTDPTAISCCHMEVCVTTWGQHEQ